MDLWAGQLPEPENETPQKVGTQDHVEMKVEQHAGLLISEGEDGQTKSVREGQKVDCRKVRHGEWTDMGARDQGGIIKSFAVTRI